MDLLRSVSAVIVMGVDGGRIFSKYFTEEFTAGKSAHRVQEKFEKGIFEKIAKSGSPASSDMDDILTYEKHLVLFRVDADVCLFVIGDLNENPLILSNVLTGMYDTLSYIFRGHIEKRTILENYDILVLIVDELVDEGIVLETDAGNLQERVFLRRGELDVPFGEQTLSQAISTAKDQISRSLLK